MNAAPSRSPPALARILCPFCDRLWFRYAAMGNSDLAEILCHGIGCYRLITFRLINGKVSVEEALNRKPAKG